jgi:hypothetical protein
MDTEVSGCNKYKPNAAVILQAAISKNLLSDEAGKIRLVESMRFDSGAAVYSSDKACFGPSASGRS